MSVLGKLERREHAGIPVMRIPYAPLDGIASVWWRRLDANTHELQSAAESLSPAERARADRFGSAVLRERYIIGRATLRGLLSGALHAAPSSLAITCGRRGRPMLAPAGGLDFNVSHTGDVAVFAIATGASPRIGVDIEPCRRKVAVERLARRLLSAAEREHLATFEDEARRLEFLKFWTCKEALCKATGDGIAAPFARITVHPGALPTLLDGPAPYLPAHWQLHRIPMPIDCIVTIALRQTFS